LKKFFLNPIVHAAASWVTITIWFTKAIKYLNNIFPLGSIMENSWYDIFLLCLISTAVIFSIHAYLRAERSRKDLIVLNTRLDGQFKKIDSKFEAVGKSLKGIEKSITETVDLVASNQKDMNEKFSWLYQQINNDKKKTPNITPPDP
jgi:hypothetical protein